MSSAAAAAAAFVAAFDAAASAASQAFAAAMTSDESSKSGWCRTASKLTSSRSTVAAASAGDAPRLRVASPCMVFTSSGVS